MYKISLLVFLMGHTYNVCFLISHQAIDYIWWYRNKAAIKDERVFGSVKCHVLYFFSFFIKLASSYLTKEEEQQ